VKKSHSHKGDFLLPEEKGVDTVRAEDGMKQGLEFLYEESLRQKMAEWDAMTISKVPVVVFCLAALVWFVFWCLGVTSKNRKWLVPAKWVLSGLALCSLAWMTCTWGEFVHSLHTIERAIEAAKKEERRRLYVNIRSTFWLVEAIQPAVQMKSQIGYAGYAVRLRREEGRIEIFMREAPPFKVDDEVVFRDPIVYQSTTSPRKYGVRPGGNIVKPD